MTKFEKIRTRIIVAQSIGVSPDDINVMDLFEKDAIYVINDFKGYSFGLMYDTVPSVEEAREKVKSAYLSGVEWDFDEEMKFI